MIDGGYKNAYYARKTLYMNLIEFKELYQREKGRENFSLGTRQTNLRTE